jgi:hypothetical protein
MRPERCGSPRVERARACLGELFCGRATCARPWLACCPRARTAACSERRWLSAGSSAVDGSSGPFVLPFRTAGVVHMRPIPFAVNSGSPETFP